MLSTRLKQDAFSRNRNDNGAASAKYAREERCTTMNDGAYVIEVDGDAAGLALAERGGFRFAAAANPYWKIDGRRFRDLRQAERAARALARATSI